jgi:hypothetical protein
MPARTLSPLPRFQHLQVCSKAARQSMLLEQQKLGIWTEMLQKWSWKPLL